MKTSPARALCVYLVSSCAAFSVGFQAMAQDSTVSRPGTPVIELLTELPTDGAVNPYSFVVNPNFQLDDLPTERMKEIHKDWWTAYRDSDNHYQIPPEKLFAPASVKDWKSNGTYHLARHGGEFLGTIIDFMRTTGDPAALSELVKWSKQIKSNLRDHDNRGYEYFEYAAVIETIEEDNRHNLDDTHWLDEQMMAGTIAQLGYVLHLNRSVSPEAGIEADFWFDYLDSNWIPKWLARSTFHSQNKYTPSSSLGLQNVVNWDGGVGGTGGNAGDIVGWAAADFFDGSTGSLRFNNESGIVHMYPAHHFSHPYVMSVFLYMALGRYFDDTGKTPAGAYITGTAQDYIDEANTRNEWWFKKVRRQSDGSLEWFHFMNRSASGSRTDAYSQVTAYYLHALHWHQFGGFADHDNMQGFAKVWYNGDPNSASDVYNAGDTTAMKRLSDGSGGDIAFLLNNAGLLGCWDETGELLKLNESTIISPTSHKIFSNQSTNSTLWHHNINHNTILSCELLEAHGVKL